MTNDLWVSAKEAAQLLGVKQPTVYAYASRGLLGTGRRGPGQKARYLRSAVLRLKLRAEARSGHTAVAAGALRWGEPVLDSAITHITTEGPVYRGHSAVSLADRDFESVAELLWTGVLPAKAPTWPAPPRAVPADSSGGPIIPRLAWLAASLGLRVDVRYGLAPEVELERARGIIQALASRAGAASGTVAGRLFHACTGRSPTRAQRALVDRCLVLSADHELNASAFAARVAAGAGTDLHGCLTAALATLSGPRHGGACDRAEAFLAEAIDLGPGAAMHARLARGDDLPGFDAGAYPDGDPRTPPLLEGARTLKRSKALDVLLELVARVKRELGQPAALDLGLVAAAVALGLPRGSAAGLFAIGRTAGWVAHILEQRATGQAIRPRARYVGAR